MRTIDADVLKAAFETDGYLSPYMQRMIDACPTVGEWISVEDGLPEDNVEVLVYAIGNNADSVIAMTSYTHNMHGYHIEGWRTPWQYFFYEHKITHWMLPPEPPKEG